MPGCRYTDSKWDLWLENVECTVYPEADDEDEQVARARHASERLEATLWGTATRARSLQLRRWV
jgi:hypothetical protein